MQTPEVSAIIFGAHYKLSQGTIGETKIHYKIIHAILSQLDSYFVSRFDALPACDRQTDRHGWTLDTRERTHVVTHGHRGIYRVAQNKPDQEQDSRPRDQQPGEGPQIGITTM